MIGAAALVIVLAAGVSAYIYLRPGDRALNYHSLKVLHHVTAAVPVTSTWNDSEVIGNRIYFASAGGSGDTDQAGVVAIDAGSSKPAWTSTAAGSARSWETMVALPDEVVLTSGVDSTTYQRRMAVLDAKDGKLLWTQQIGDDDDILYVGDRVVWRDKQGKVLYGLDLRTGKPAWHVDDSANADTPSTLITATTPKDLAGPATIDGRPLDPDLGDDARIVQINYDRSARVIDATSGKVLATRQGVADTTDDVVAHNGRLFVRESETSQRIVSYGLAKLDKPQILYQAQGQNGKLDHLSSCGDDRICFVESDQTDTKSGTVVAVDAAKGGKIWSYRLSGADTLVPVGKSLLASASNNDVTTLLDDKGHALWSGNKTGARLDAGNILWFSKSPTPYTDTQSIEGQHVGNDQFELGPLTDIRSSTCSWNTSVLACAGDTDYEVISYAG